jgi:asparagine synthase (glutamine-hydrolysing)
VPTPIPELSDLLARLGWKTFANRLKIWALHQRRPWFLLLGEVLQGFLPSASAAKHLQSPAWLKPEFATRFQSALRGYRSRLRMFGPLPSFQLNISALQILRRQVGCSAIASAPAYELRYPYLDRDLLEFIYATPREQLVRPGERRSLMRRALVTIVPPVVLNRRRKGFVCRSLLSAISARMPTWQATGSATIGEALGIFDSRVFRATLEAVHRDREVDLVRLIRTLEVEQWLRSVMGHCPPESQRQLRKLHTVNSAEDSATGTQLPSARTG